MKSMSLHFGGFISITPYVLENDGDISIFLTILLFRHFKCVSPNTEKDPDDLLSIENVAATFDQIGHLYARRKEKESAKYYYEQGIEIYEKLLESDPGNIDNEIDLADSFNYIGELYKFLEPEIARNYFEKALSINEKAVKLFPESTKYKEDLIYTLKNLASLNIGQDQDENAIPLHERITELSLGNGQGKSWRV